MTIDDIAYTPACVRRPEAYLDERHQLPPDRTEMSLAEWDNLTTELAVVRRDCARCPYLVDCLYRAVVEVDVYGYAACTTAEDRNNIRRMLGIELQRDGNDSDGMSRIGNGPVNHASVLAMRHAYPQDSFGQLAERLRCSLSTVKRHMRRAREVAQAAPMPARRTPTVDEVLDCFDQLDARAMA